MSRQLAYAAATVHLAAAVVRHLADGLNLLGEAINPSHVVTLTHGATRREWCEECRTHHAAVTVYAHDNDDPTDARPVGSWVDCDLHNDPEDEA